MQIDMHYYGTYVMAKTAGMNSDAAHTVATAAQFVDDWATKKQIVFEDAGQIDSEATAHHTYDFANLDKDDQRQIWVPFHFLPGNEGDSVSERLICRKDSPLCSDMLQQTLSHLGNANAAYRVGIAAHVYADTFAHYGFSGLSSRWNKVDNSSFFFPEMADSTKEQLAGKKQQFDNSFGHECSLTNIKSWFGEVCSGALGHAAVATFPDQPYLVWEFSYEHPEKHHSGTRSNPETFLEACQKLHTFFKQVIQSDPSFDGGGEIDFATIQPAILDILSHEGGKAERSTLWKNRAEAGAFGLGFSIPDYAGEQWLAEAKKMYGSESSAAALDTNVYKYLCAASAHRNYVLRELLPQNGLVVA